MANDLPNQIVTDLSNLRVGAIVAKGLGTDHEESHFLVRSFQEYVNKLLAQVDGEDFTFEEAFEFVFTDILESENPYEAAYILQQRVLRKTAAHPEKFRDPDPLRTMKDVRGMHPEMAQAYMAGLRAGF
jgi:hypothetical protein